MKLKVWMICGAWALFALFNFLAPKRVFSEAENRYLEQKPKLDKKAVLSGAYTEGYEKWMTDQLILRDGFVSLKASVDRTLGRGDIGGVYLGQDGYLLEMFTKTDREKLNRNTEKAAGFLERMEAEGRTVHFLMVPTGACVMEDKLPRYAPELDQRAMLEELGEKLPGFVNAEPALRRAWEELPECEENQLYYRTDHHWTSLGAYYAYQALCQAEGREAPELSEYEREVLSTGFYGSSYARAGLYGLKPDTMYAMYRKSPGAVQVDYGTGEPENSLYDRSFLAKRDKYRVFLKGNYPLTRIAASAENGKKLLLIKDSFANTFVQFLTEDYEEILVVDPRYYRQDLEILAREEAVTDVLYLYEIKKFAEEG